MKLVNLSATNFLSYKDLNVDFEEGLFLINGFNFDENTSNGSGKSSIIDAICFALYGETPRDVNLDELASWDNDDGCQVSITFNANQKVHLIKRTRRPAGLVYTIDSNPVLGADSKVIQSKIESNIGLSKDAFLRSVYFAQDMSPADQFLMANDTTRKDILTEIMKLEILDICFDKTKDTIKKTTDRKNTISSDLEKLESEYKRSLDTVANMESMPKIFEQELSDSILRLEELKQISTQTKNFDFELQKLNSEIGILNECLTADNNDLTYLESSIDTISKELKSVETNYSKLQWNLDNFGKQYKKVSEIGDVCSSCNQSVSADFTKNQLDLIGGQQEVLRIAMEDYKEKIDISHKELNNLKTKRIELLSSINNKNHSITTNKAKIESLLNSDKIEKDKIRVQIGLEESKILKLKDKLSEFSILIEKTRANCLDILNNIDKSKAELTNISPILAALEFLYIAFGKQGIKARVFSNALFELEKLINVFLAELFVEDVRIKIENSTVGKGGIKLVIEWNGDKISLGSLSGGEKRRIIVAVNFALSSLMGSRTLNMPNFICLDECFNGLDANGKLKIMEFLENLKMKKDFIWVIDHQSEFQSMFDGIYKVEKRNGISQVIQ